MSQPATITVTQTETVTTSTSSGCGAVDPLYLKGIPGILKCLECGFSLLAFILQAAAVLCISPSTNGYFLFVTMTVFWVNLAFYFILLLKLKGRLFCCDCIDWPLIEVGYYSVVLIFYFFANLFIAIGAHCSPSSQAATAFGFFAMFVFIADLILAVRVFMDSRHLHQSQQQAYNPDVETQRY